MVERQFLPKDWIMEQWDAGYYITAIAGSSDASSLVVMSKGARFSQQSYKVSEALPYEWIRKKWREVRRRGAAAMTLQSAALPDNRDTSHKPGICFTLHEQQCGCPAACSPDPSRDAWLAAKGSLAIMHSIRRTRREPKRALGL